MMRCPECSRENNEDASFCQYCGTKFAHLETEKKIVLEDNQIESDSNKHFDLESRSTRDLIISLLVILDTILIGFILLYPSYSNSIYILGFDLIVCLVLLIEFIWNKLSKDYESTLKEDAVDILAMIPLWFFVLIPQVWVNYLAFVRLFRIVVLLQKGKKHIFNFFQKTNFSYLFITLFILICAGSVAMLVLESSPTDEINTPMDALWYVMATVSTVGYGDITPESFGGKLIGIFLMVVGAGFFSLLTAYLASWFMEEHEEEEDEIKNRIIGMEKSVDEMKSEIKELKELLKENK
ncbi:ion channel [Methanobacterium sp.]|uniref:potassium channel family protein n=1 Tax=Methanobacterium sp. TaxID=2164 RepID=UPI003C72E6BD